MAINIIKNSLIDPIEMTCDECGSVFTFNYDDIEVKICYDVIGYKRKYRHVECPVCKHQCTLVLKDNKNMTRGQ